MRILIIPIKNKSDPKVILFTPASRIRMLEDMNQQQYIAIKTLMRELEQLNEKLRHLEKLLLDLDVKL